MTAKTFYMSLLHVFDNFKCLLPSLRVFVNFKSFCRLSVSLSTLKVFLPSLCVFANFKYRFAIFACLCPSLCVFVNLKRLFTVFACLCVSLRTEEPILIV